jgi:hypothetical protein
LRLADQTPSRFQDIAMDDDAKPARGRGASTHVERREKVAQVCRRIADGEKLGHILRTDGLPMPPTFHAWVARSAELGSMYEGAKADGRRVARPFEARLYTPELGREFCERLTVAEGLDEVCAQPDMPCEMTVYRWCREIPEFREWYRAARELHAHWLFDEAWRIARHARWDGWRGARLAIDTIRWRIAVLAPESYGKRAGEGEANGKAPWVVEVVKFGDLTEAERANYGRVESGGGST